MLCVHRHHFPTSAPDITPRTPCACQPVAATISSTVAPSFHIRSATRIYRPDGIGQADQCFDGKALEAMRPQRVLPLRLTTGQGVEIGRDIVDMATDLPLPVEQHSRDDTDRNVGRHHLAHGVEHPLVTGIIAGLLLVRTRLCRMTVRVRSSSPYAATSALRLSTCSIRLMSMSLSLPEIAERVASTCPKAERP